MKIIRISLTVFNLIMGTLTFIFADYDDIIANPVFQRIWFPILMGLLIALFTYIIVTLFSKYLKSEFKKVLENQEEIFDSKEKEINKLLNKLSEFQSNKYILRDIQDVVNNHAFLIEKSKKLYEIPNYRDAKIFDLVHNTEVKKLKFIDVGNEPDPNNK